MVFVSSRYTRLVSLLSRSFLVATFNQFQACFFSLTYLYHPDLHSSRYSTVLLKRPLISTPRLSIYTRRIHFKSTLPISASASPHSYWLFFLFIFPLEGGAVELEIDWALGRIQHFSNVRDCCHDWLSSCATFVILFSSTRLSYFAQFPHIWRRSYSQDRPRLAPDLLPACQSDASDFESLVGHLTFEIQAPSWRLLLDIEITLSRHRFPSPMSWYPCCFTA